MTGGDGSAAADSVMTDDAGLVVPLQYPLLKTSVVKHSDKRRPATTGSSRRLWLERNLVRSVFA